MTPQFPGRQRLWQLAAAVVLVSGSLFFVRWPDPPPSPVDKAAKRIAFCASVIDAIKPNDKTCGPYLQQARQLVARQKQEAKPPPVSGQRLRQPYELSEEDQGYVAGAMAGTACNANHQKATKEESAATFTLLLTQRGIDPLAALNDPELSKKGLLLYGQICGEGGL